MRYDVIIAGASFAGLAVAAQLRGKQVLLLDRKPIGVGQTSACGTLVCTLQALGLEDAILQVHNRLVIHTPDRTFVYPVAEPFCTFDYPTLCRLLREQGDAEFVQAPALGLTGDQVRTSQGFFHGDLIVDASGWRAALGGQIWPDLVRRDRLNFGMETVVPYQDDGLHFWYDPQDFLPMGIAWAFPIGEFSRIGVGSYRGDTRLGRELDGFLADLGRRRDGVHGGYFPHTLRDPAKGDLFLVGDAAGQCLGLTGEGIRPALFFGTHLGHLLHRVLEDEISLEEARRAYQKLVAARKPYYDVLCLAQRVLPRLPLPLVQGLMATISRPVVLCRVLALYTQAFWMEVNIVGRHSLAAHPSET
ncbi:MAG TPA: NAD(P)/FAD-dependent oxidoreductase [Anaerolineae bacterium]|nr:NAD(P)/FAD-dependent oxidoreductase [Anaerolineae bacterium]